MNGKKLTKRQLQKVKRVEHIMKQLQSEGVQPVLYSSNLTFWRNANLDPDYVYTSSMKSGNKYQDTRIYFNNLDL